jgi:hypothetical protein
LTGAGAKLAGWIFLMKNGPGAAFLHGGANQTLSVPRIFQKNGRISKESPFFILFLGRILGALAHEPNPWSVLNRELLI